MKKMIPAATAFVFALSACGEATDTTAEPAYQDDQEIVEERTADEAPPTEVDGATISVNEDGVNVDANVEVTDGVSVDVDTDSN